VHHGVVASELPPEVTTETMAAALAKFDQERDEPRC